MFGYLSKLYNFMIFYIKGGVSYARRIGVTVGEDCRIYTTYFGSEPFLISVGDRVTITTGVKIITHDGSAWLARDEKGRRFKFQRVQIGNDVFVGVNSLILPGVVVEDEVIIAAGSVVAKSIPKGSVVAGVPAKIIGSYTKLKRKMLNEYISSQEMNMKTDYKSRVLRIIDNSRKEYLN